MASKLNSKQSNTTRIIAAVVIAGAATFAAVAAYGFEPFGEETSYDSNLAQFMKRSDSSLLKVVRLQQAEGTIKHFEQYSFASSNPTLYQYLSSVDKAHARGKAPESGLQMAYIEVIISSGQTEAILREISSELQESNSEYDVYSEDIAVGRGQYSVVLMVPK